MRLYIGLLAIVLIILLIDLAFYFIFLHKRKKHKTWLMITLGASFLYGLFWAYLFSCSPKTYSYLQPDNYPLFFLASTLMIVFYIPRLFAIVVKGLLFLLVALKIIKNKLAILISLSVAAMFMTLTITGIFFLRFQFRVIEQTIEHPSIPVHFDDYKIVQISDLHLGTAKKYKSSFNKMVEKINNLNPDIVVFTGDLVNNFASELDGWDEVLGNIKAKSGVYAILGNHDYGDYVRWNSDMDKQQNITHIVSFFRNIHWTLLRNESHLLINNSDTIILAGVENWGNPPFPKYGDLKQTVPDTTKLPVILLSHDPSHWDEEVKDHPANIFLTLSGHTHGFQFGIRSQWLNISPVSLKYEKWGGLYEENNKYLYVNVGAGTIGFPGRIGMRPEITLIRLKHDPEKKLLIN